MTVATSTRRAPTAGRGERVVLTRRQQAFRRLLIHSFLILAAFVMVYPVLWLLGQSFQPDQKIFSGQIVPTGDFTFRNYVDGWGALQFGTFTRFFLNSAVITALAVLGNLMSCSLAAYALARLRFPGRRIFFALTIGTLMLPYHVLIIPQYVLFSQLGWVNTILPLVLPKFLATDAFYVFLMVQFIRTLPEELTESAKLDGCGHLRIFARIILPLSLPALGTTAVFTFIHTWNDFLTPLIYLASPEHYTVPLALQMFVDASGGQSSYGSLFAMSILSLGPVIGFFIAFQRTLVQGIATTGLK